MRKQPKAEALAGAAYVAAVNLRGADGLRVAVGESCASVSPASLGWLADQGLIVPADRAPRAKEST